MDKALGGNGIRSEALARALRPPLVQGLVSDCRRLQGPGESCCDIMLGAVGPLIGFTVAQVACLLGRSASTVRSWAAAGIFGDPTVRKLNHREYRIPAHVLIEVASRLQAGDRIVVGIWVRGAIAVSTPPKIWRQDSVAVSNLGMRAPAKGRRPRGLTKIEDPLARYRPYLRTRVPPRPGSER